MIEYVIRRAIIWAVTIAIVASVSAAVRNATRNALSKSLEGKLEELGIDKDDPNGESIAELIDVDVTKRGDYFITIHENVYGKFSTAYNARNKEDAIRKLGRKVFGFVSVNKNRLSKEEKNFYMRIWFETFAKGKIERKLYLAECHLSNVVYDVGFFQKNIENLENKLLSLTLKLKKAESKNNLKKVKKVNTIIDEYKNMNKINNDKMNVLKEEQKALTEKISSMKEAISEPEFVYSSKKIGLKQNFVFAK